MGKKKKTKDKPPGGKTVAEMSPGEIAAQLTDAPKDFIKAAAPMLKDIIGLLQIATAGKAEKVQDLIDMPGNFLEKLLNVDQSAVLGVLEAKGLWYLLEPVDESEKITHKTKLEWGKLLRDIAIYAETKEIAEPRGNIEGPASKEVARFKNELLRELDKDRKKIG